MAPSPDFISQMQRGQAHWQAGEFEQAAQAFDRACKIAPDDLTARANYAMALAKSNDLQRAISILQDLAPQMNNAEIYYNLGNAYRLSLRLDEAVAAFSQAIALRPQYAEAHWNRAISLLAAGKLKQAWNGYEWRFHLPGRKPMPFAGPAWDGSIETLKDRSIILGAEQGFGDAIQFARYIPMVAKAAKQTTVICHPELKRLFAQTFDSIAHVMTPRETPPPPYHTHAALMSLPRLFGTALETIPANVPYLSADSAQRAKWKDRLSPFASTRKVGLVWAGRPTHQNDKNRSIVLSELEPLASASGVTLVSLQKGAAAEQIQAISWSSAITDWSSELADFSDTAALICELDLVICAETAVAHLAGALGKPVWTMLPYVPDWRWMLDRADTPWYPTMRLFRQPKPRDWQPVIAAILNELRGLS